MSQEAHMVTIEPAFLGREAAARFLDLSEAQLGRLSATGDVPKPRKISKGRVAWLAEELRAWARARPVSDLLPPPDSGYGRAGKPASS